MECRLQMKNQRRVTEDNAISRSEGRSHTRAGNDHGNQLLKLNATRSTKLRLAQKKSLRLKAGLDP